MSAFMRSDRSPDRGPAVSMRTSLVYARRTLHMDFDAAWDFGLEDAVRGLRGENRQSWLSVFEDTRESWRTGYERSGQVLAVDAELIQL